MLENVYDELYEYVAFTRYPITSSKNERRIIRRKCLSTFMQLMACTTPSLALAKR